MIRFTGKELPQSLHPFRTKTESWHTQSKRSAFDHKTKHSHFVCPRKKLLRFRKKAGFFGSVDKSGGDDLHQRGAGVIEALIQPGVKTNDDEFRRSPRRVQSMLDQIEQRGLPSTPGTEHAYG